MPSIVCTQKKEKICSEVRWGLERSWCLLYLCHSLVNIKISEHILVLVCSRWRGLCCSYMEFGVREAVTYSEEPLCTCYLHMLASFNT